MSRQGRAGSGRPLEGLELSLVEMAFLREFQVFMRVRKKRRLLLALGRAGAVAPLIYTIF